MHHTHFRFGITLLRMSLALVGCITLGFGLLLAAYSLPLAPIANHVRLSVPTLDGSWETGEIAYEQLIKGYVSTQLDNSTDANMLLAAAHQSDQPLVRQVLDASTYLLDGRSYPALLAYGQTGAENLDNAPMARYWLGFLVFLKPLLSVMSYMDIRMLLIILQLGLLCAVVAGMVHRGLLAFIPAFAMALLAITPAITGFSMQFSTVYTLFLLAMLSLLVRPKILVSHYHTALFFLFIGAATSYFDYLTYPIATFGMPFVLVLLLQPTAQTKQTFRLLLICLVAWFFGYLGMWAGKWALTMALGGDAWFLPNLLAKITERSTYAAQDVSISFPAVMAAIINVFSKKAYLAVGVIAALFYLAVLVYVKARRTGILRNVTSATAGHWAGLVVPLLLTSTLPIIWYAFTSNHTFSHVFFTSRALVVTGFAGMVLLTLPLCRVSDAGRTEKRE